MRIAALRAENLASSWYRCYFWMEALRDRGHKVFFDSAQKFSFDAWAIEKLVKGADVVVMGRTNDAQLFAAMMAGRHLFGYKLIVDTDDLIGSIPEFHPAKKDFHGGSGIPRITLAEYREADAVTVSTPTLLAEVAPHAKQAFLVPNCASRQMWAGVRHREKEERHRDDIRIYWGGGGGHYGDLLLVREPLLEIARSNPLVKLIFQNFVPDWAMALPANQVYFLNFVDFHTYPKSLVWACPDIAIAPLDDNPHNRCKSHVKYLDYGMAGIAGIYQDLEPYESVQPGVTGLKAKTADDWHQAISSLISDSSLRREVAANAKTDILANWTIERHVGRYETILQELIATKPAPELQMLSESQPIEAPCLAP